MRNRKKDKSMDDEDIDFLFQDLKPGELYSISAKHYIAFCWELSAIPIKSIMKRDIMMYIGISRIHREWNRKFLFGNKIGIIHNDVILDEAKKHK